MRLAWSLASLFAVTFLASSAAAEPPAPDAFPPQEEPTPAPHAEAPSEETPQFRDHGLRLGLELGFARATTARSDNLTGGTPTILPLGVDLSFHTSKRVLVGLHGSAALGSRDDCTSANHCIARDYTLGAHVEATFLEGRRIVPFFRYGMGWELLYHGGRVGEADAHQFRDAFDLVDARIGADYVASRGADGKSTRIGAYLGMIGGIAMDRSGGTNSQNAEFGSPGHLWLGLGIRATMDP